MRERGRCQVETRQPVLPGWDLAACMAQQPSSPAAQLLSLSSVSQISQQARTEDDEGPHTHTHPRLPPPLCPRQGETLR